MKALLDATTIVQSVAKQINSSVWKLTFESIPYEILAEKNREINQHKFIIIVVIAIFISVSVEHIITSYSDFMKSLVIILSDFMKFWRFQGFHQILAKKNREINQHKFIIIVVIAIFISVSVEHIITSYSDFMKSLVIILSDFMKFWRFQGFPEIPD